MARRRIRNGFACVLLRTRECGSCTSINNAYYIGGMGKWVSGRSWIASIYGCEANEVCTGNTSNTYCFFFSFGVLLVCFVCVVLGIVSLGYMNARGVGNVECNRMDGWLGPFHLGLIC
jgi:hypothetical protein